MELHFAQNNKPTRKSGLVSEIMAFRFMEFGIWDGFVEMCSG